MNKYRLALTLALALLTFSCAGAPETEVLWVGGIRTEASAGAGKALVLNVIRGDYIHGRTWENFYAPIEGFTYEEGYRKKIEVRVGTRENPPADGSALTYTLVRELEKKQDERFALRGSWILARINDHPLNRKIKLPELEIILSSLRAGGDTGCNSYTADIAGLTDTSLRFGPIAATMRICADENIEREYLSLLEKVSSYRFDGSLLQLLDGEGRLVLSFLKKQEQN